MFPLKKNILGQVNNTIGSSIVSLGHSNFDSIAVVLGVILG